MNDEASLMKDEASLMKDEASLMKDEESLMKDEPGQVVCELRLVHAGGGYGGPEGGF